MSFSKGGGGSNWVHKGMTQRKVSNKFICEHQHEKRRGVAYPPHSLSLIPLSLSTSGVVIKTRGYNKCADWYEPATKHVDACIPRTHIHTPTQSRRTPGSCPEIRIQLVSLCIHRGAFTIPLSSLCIHRNAPSHKIRLMLLLSLRKK